MISLNEKTIRQQLALSSYTTPIHIHLLSSIDSTNRFLKERPKTHATEVCCAEEQTEGRGRFGRHWHSPFGKNIYFSMRLQIHADISQLSGFSLVLSMAVCATLSMIHSPHPVRIKWPNDVMWCHQKLSGNLIEVISTNPGKATDVVIGIGLNVNDTAHDEPLIDKPWCSLYDITGQQYDRNILIAQLIIQVERHLKQLIQHGFSSFLSTWQPLDYLLNQHMTVSQPMGSFSGRAQGLNNEGLLILVDDAGVTHYLSSGDTSIKAAG